MCLKGVSSGQSRYFVPVLHTRAMARLQREGTILVM